MAEKPCILAKNGGGVNIRSIKCPVTSVSIQGGSSASKTIDFTNDMTSYEDIISVNIAGTGSESVVPRYWVKATRTTVQVSLRNLSSSSQTAGLEVQVIVAKF